MKKHIKITSFLFFFGIIFQITAQELLTFQVDAGAYDRKDCPVSFQISPSELNITNQEIQIIEYFSNSEKLVATQFNKNNNQLWFILDGFTSKHTIRNFAIVKNNKKNKTPIVKIHKKDGGLLLSYKNNPILNYQYKIVEPPEGVDEKYRKSGFIHPVWSPLGEILTRIQPPDHYHHYGIWGPWTRTHIGERQVDFWNLAEGQGTVLFKEFMNETEGEVFSGFTALQEHIDFGASAENKVAINEELEIKIYNLKSSKPYRMVDYTTTITSPLASGVLFDAYRYGGGIGFRATEKWHKDNSRVLTSENKDRLSADGSSAKWAIIEGGSETKEGTSGILFMGLPTNREFPEPMRVWPIDSNEGRGDMFFEFCPIRHKEWQIESQKEYSLNYRMIIFDGNLTAEEAELYWQGFANPPKVIIKSN